MFSCGTMASEKRTRLQSLRVVDIDMAGLAGVQHALESTLPSLSLTSVMTGGAHRVEIPHVMRDVLEVADVLAGVEVDRDERVRVEVVARAQRAVEIGRRIADHEVDAVRREIDRRVLPHAAAERLVGIAVFGKRRLLGRDVAMHVAAGRVRASPTRRRSSPGWC